MNKKQCKDALDFYKKFLVRMDRVAEFLKVAENVGIDKGDIPDLTRVTLLSTTDDVSLNFWNSRFLRHLVVFLKPSRLTWPR